MSEQKATAEQAAVVEEQEFKRCACGCGAGVSPKRSFKPGHDARHRGNLLRLWDTGQGAMAEELVERGWYTWDELHERTAKRDAKAEAKAERETKRINKSSALG